MFTIVQKIVSEIDEDGNGEMSFEEFAHLAARFLVEEDEDTEAILKELKDAFRLYDKEGKSCKQIVIYVSRPLNRFFSSECDSYNAIKKLCALGAGCSITARELRFSQILLSYLNSFPAFKIVLRHSYLRYLH